MVLDYNIIMMVMAGGGFCPTENLHDYIEVSKLEVISLVNQSEFLAQLWLAEGSIGWCPPWCEHNLQPSQPPSELPCTATKVASKI